MSGISDHAERGGGDPGLFANGDGEGDLVAGANRNFWVRYNAAAGNVDDVHAERFQAAGQFDRLRKIPAPFLPIGGRDAEEERQARGPDFADGLGDAQGEAHPVFERATVVVGANVGERGEKFVSEIAVSAVNFDEFESSGEGALGGATEGGDNLVDFGDR